MAPPIVLDSEQTLRTPRTSLEQIALASPPKPSGEPPQQQGALTPEAQRPAEPPPAPAPPCGNTRVRIDQFRVGLDQLGQLDDSFAALRTKDVFLLLLGQGVVRDARTGRDREVERL